ncbi:MAG TPA: response regulator [Salinimicrobium sp.]|nr:response regulator [Salinimicrobium sp.]
MIKNYLLSFVGLLLFFPAFSQAESRIPQDSLKNIYKLSSQAVREYDYKNSQILAQQLIELASRNKDSYFLYHGYNILGVGYEALNDFDRAKENYEKSLENALSTKNDTLLWWAYNNLGNIFSQHTETVQKGLFYYDNAIKIASRISSDQVLTPVINKGWTHLENKQFDQAYPYLIKAREIFGDGNDKYVRTQLETLFGMYYAGLGDFERATCFFGSAINLAENDNLLVEASLAYGEFSKMLFRKGDFEEAYAALEKHQEFEGKIYEAEKLHQMETARARFETDLYRKNLALAKREQTYKDDVIAKSQEITVIMVISLVVLLVFLVLLFKNNRHRNKLISQLKDKNKELLDAKEEAERLSSLKTRFFSTVSHELRTPLYGVVGLTSLLLEENKNEKQVEDLKSLKFSADYLLALINDVLQMNKMESKLLHLENVPFNIADLIRGIVKSFEFTRHQNQNTIELHIDPEIPRYLIGDSIRLSQILMNLVGNAIKFTERGSVWIKAESKKCENNTCLIYFEIGDTGMGIPENKQQVIFEEFSQLRSTNYNYQGTGLGLSIVKKLLDIFDSEIHLKSVEGKGSVFSFEILFKEDPSIGKEADIFTETEEENFSRKILIVDDNRINQIVTQRILEKRDFECSVASDGFQAIKMIQKEHFDVVLMDVNMPGMSGMETTVKIREFDAEIPIIALTAVEIDEMREEILSSGMNDIIVKPYDTHKFFQIIFRNLLMPVG